MSDMILLCRDLAPRLPDIATTLRGPPNMALSDRKQMRWGRKGSFVVHLAGRRAGRWDDYEAGAGGDALDLIRAERGCSLMDAIAWARDWLGTPEMSRRRDNPPARREAPVVHDADRIARALQLWQQAVDPRDTVVEAYLTSRGLELPPEMAGRVLRFHPKCPWGTSDDGTIYVPAMLAAMTDIGTNEVQGVHRTALTPNGEKIGRKMLGHASGTVIRLCPDEEVSLGLGIVEGIENGLSVLAQGWRPVWACGSAGAIARFPILSGIECLTVFADHDGAGQEAAQAVATRYQAAGIEVVIRYPADHGRDWNDLHMRRAAA